MSQCRRKFKCCKKLTELAKKQPVVVITDGAAFGAYISTVLAVAKQNEDVMLYFPESFECGYMLNLYLS